MKKRTLTIIAVMAVVAIYTVLEFIKQSRI